MVRIVVISADDYLEQVTNPDKVPHEHAEKAVQTDKECIQPQSSTVRRSATAVQPDNAQQCKDVALRLLDAASRSSKALIDKLVQRGFDHETATSVIHHLCDLQLINDKSYAQGLVRHCLNRSMGEYATYMELVHKGVDKNLAKQLCEQARQEGLFEQSAWQLGQQVARKTDGLPYATRTRRLWSAAQRKGHNADVIQEISAALFSKGDDE